MRFHRLVGLAVLAIPTALTAQQTVKHGADLSIGITSGSLGFGAEISKLVTSHIGVRAGVNFFSMHQSLNQSDVDFSATLKMKAITGLVDLYPGSRGSFHLTGGIITNPLNVKATGQSKVDGMFTINNHEYTSADVGVLTGTANWPSASPYVGFGIGTPANSHGGLKFITDFGVAIGKPKITLTSSNPGNNATLQSDMDAQVVKTQTDVNKYAKVYPVISAGLVLRF